MSGKQKLRAIKHKASWVAKHPGQVVETAAGHARLAVQAGPGKYMDLRRQKRSHQFGCGIKTAYSQYEINTWRLAHSYPLVLLLVGETVNDERARELVALQAVVRCHFFAAPSVAEKLQALSDDMHIATATAQLTGVGTFTFTGLRATIMQTHMDNDIILINLADMLPDHAYFETIQHVAYNYHEEVGIVAPSYLYDSQQYSGVEFDRTAAEFRWMGSVESDIGQLAIPRYTLTNYWHGLYVRFDTLSRLALSSTDINGSIDEVMSYVIGRAWQQNIRTLTYSPLQLQVVTLPNMKLLPFHTTWLLEPRRTTNAKGQTRVIYVLNATTVSGGIKVVFEHVNGLLKRGFEVEIWSVQGQPDWMDVNVTVKKFYNYQDIELALRDEDAIKIATWWETGPPVWLASVNRGVGVNFIQEFEPWFYPDDADARAAVVSTYRRELVSTTTTSYNQDELEAVGLRDMMIIPVGYDGSVYHEDKKVPRATDTMLAVGRSFFQKNFEFTKQAWLSLGDKRPALTLFGSEPDILHDERVQYHVKPTNEEVNTLYNTATLMVQTSRHEGFCLPAIEAMAAGCPLICTDMHGNRDFCIDGETCLMVEHDNIAQLAGVIERLKEDTELQAKLRKNGLAMAKEYEWSAIIDRVGEFYKSLS